MTIAPAFAGTPDDHYLLTAGMVQKLKAANKSLAQADLPEDTPAQEKEDDKYRVKGELPVERFILSIERRPQARALVLKHGFTPKDYGLATYAMLDAVMHLTYEKMGSKDDVAKQYAKLTKEQQANVALLRKLGPAAYSSN
ncbi:hypothetical protein [Massilia sp. IC2-476]|uniref:hypothetical protein n=1 Tax=Massilia sp. IC2-476 TaxID=2887199 RepID=UPI001D0FBDE3|nr:hypothetical protein [Massilia sp. IC2-476]MCC2974148.1 hypothetical protein [Massilia sp. IC2-476]